MTERLLTDAISKMKEHTWEAMSFKDRQELIEQIVQELHHDFGPSGQVVRMGYDIDDCQMIVWDAYDIALREGTVTITD